MNILIPNATGPTNTGDQAILVSLLGIIRNIYPNGRILLHSSTPELYPPQFANSIKHHLYSWSVFENRSPFIRTLRVGKLFGYYLLPSQLWFKGDSYLAGLVNDYKEADLIVFSSGSYLRTKKGFTQSLNLLMQLLMIGYSKKLGKKIIISPTSFGPLNYKWQEYLAAATINGAGPTFIREIKSYDILNKYNLKSPVYLNHDLALFLDPISFITKTSKIDAKVLGFTVRDWFKGQKQLNFEKKLAKAIANCAQKYGLAIQPIVHVNAPQYGEGDLGSTNRMIEILKKEGVSILEKKNVTSLEEAFNIYRELEFLIGMRMHSNIISALCGVPFVAIGYEHKTKGIAIDLGVGDMCVEAEEIINHPNLGTFFINAFDQREKLASILKSRLRELREKGSNDLIASLS